MKILKTATAVALLFVLCKPANAQNAPPLNQPDYNKPKLFADLPDKLSLHLSDMEALLSLSVGASVNTVIANGLPLIGTVVSKSGDAITSLSSVVIKSTTRQGAIVTFTRIRKEDGTVLYSGRIISQKAGDTFEIVKEANAYVLRKKGLYDLINE